VQRRGGGVVITHTECTRPSVRVGCGVRKTPFEIPIRQIKKQIRRVWGSANYPLRDLNMGGLAGNEAVIRARFQDALFFYKSDLEKKLADFKPALGSITFQADLGSMLQKSDRLERLVPEIATLTGLQGQETPPPLCNHGAATSWRMSAGFAPCKLFGRQG